MNSALERLRRSPAMPTSIVLLIIIYAVGVAEIEGFGGSSTIRPVLLLSTFLGFAAAGQTVVVLVGGLDLSIAFVVDAANVVVAQLSGHGMPFGIACLIVIAAAALLGALNACISVR